LQFKCDRVPDRARLRSESFEMTRGSVHRVWWSSVFEIRRALSYCWTQVRVQIINLVCCKRWEEGNEGRDRYPPHPGNSLPSNRELAFVIHPASTSPLGNGQPPSGSASSACILCHHLAIITSSRLIAFSLKIHCHLANCRDSSLCAILFKRVAPLSLWLSRFHSAKSTFRYHRVETMMWKHHRPRTASYLRSPGVVWCHLGLRRLVTVVGRAARRWTRYQVIAPSSASWLLHIHGRGPRWSVETSTPQNHQLHIPSHGWGLRSQNWSNWKSWKGRFGNHFVHWAW